MITAIEQPLTESDVVGAVAIGEEAIVADTMEAVWQSVRGPSAPRHRCVPRHGPRTRAWSGRVAQACAVVFYLIGATLRDILGR